MIALNLKRFDSNKCKLEKHSIFLPFKMFQFDHVNVVLDLTGVSATLQVSTEHCMSDPVRPDSVIF